jgi:predicted esterase
MLCVLVIRNAFSGTLIDRKEDGYIAYVPKMENKLNKEPVLIVLPGLYCSAKTEIAYWGFHAEKKGILVIGIYVDYAKITSMNDLEKLFNRIMDTVNIFNSDKNNYSIDKEKMFLGGTSAGGMVSMTLALKHQGRFRAVGVISGSNLEHWEGTQFIGGAKGQYFYLLHGRKDPIIPINDFFETKKALETNGAIVKTYINEEVGHYMSSNDYRRAVEWFAAFN